MRQVVDDDHAGEQAGPRAAPQRVRRRRRGRAPTGRRRAASRQPGRRRRRRPRPPTSSAARPASSSAAADRVDGARRRESTATASASAPSAAAIASSCAGLDRRAARPREPSSPGAGRRGEQRAGAVLAGRHSSRASRAGRPASARSRSAARSCVLQRGRAARRPRSSAVGGRLVLGVEALLALLDAGDLRSRACANSLARLGPRCSASASDSRSRPISASARPRPASAARRPGRPAGPAPSRRSATARTAARALCSAASAASASLRAVDGRSRAAVAAACTSRVQLGLLGAHALPPARPASSGSRPGALLLGRRAEHGARRSAASVAGAAQPLLQRRQPVPGLLGLGQRRCLPRRRRARARQAALRASASAASTSARRSRSAVSSATSCSSVARSVRQVVGEQPQPGVAQVGLDAAAWRATSACRPSGLSWRRISPVRSPSRVRLACIASSLRSAFSLRLRCLRTPAASSMKPRRSSGVGAQHRVELALPDDDVHLAADAGVGQQLLDVEQPAGGAVDRVLRPAGAEHACA